MVEAAMKAMVYGEKTESSIKPVGFIKQALNSGEIEWKPQVRSSSNRLGDISLRYDGLPRPVIAGFIGTVGNAEIRIKLDYFSGGRGIGAAWGLGKGREIRRKNRISYPGSLSLSFEGKEVFYEEVGLIKNRFLYRGLLKSAQKSLNNPSK